MLTTTSSFCLLSKRGMNEWFLVNAKWEVCEVGWKKEIVWPVCQRFIFEGKRFPKDIIKLNLLYMAQCVLLQQSRSVWV